MFVFHSPERLSWKRLAFQLRMSLSFTSLTKALEQVDLFHINLQALIFSSTCLRPLSDKKSQQVVKPKCAWRLPWPVNEIQLFTGTMTSNIKIRWDYLNISTVFHKWARWFTSAKFIFPTKIWKRDSNWNKTVCFRWSILTKRQAKCTNYSSTKLWTSYQLRCSWENWA